MYASGKALQIAIETRSNRLALLGLCETGWTQAGRVKLVSGKEIIYSGHAEQNAPHTEGVALMLSKESSKTLILQIHWPDTI